MAHRVPPFQSLFQSLLPLLALLLLACPICSAQSPNTSGAASLESILNPDGSLNVSQGSHGSFSAAGWRMHLGPQGEPRFSRTSGAASNQVSEQITADTADIHWDDQFLGPTGTDGAVWAIAVRGNEVYFGGAFSRTDEIKANNIVCWDGSSWKALGAGVQGYVRALAFVDSTLYVAGHITSAGNVGVNNIAKWDGKSWSALGDSLFNGVDPAAEVTSLAVLGRDLYVGGFFTSMAGRLSANHIARWDGKAWHPVGGGTSGGNGSSGAILALAAGDSSLYAGGNFASAGGTPAKSIARWDGKAWHALGISPNDGVDAQVLALTYYRGTLYVAGNFQKVGGTVVTQSLAIWQRNAWSSLGIGVNGLIWSLAISGSKLYIAGGFPGPAARRGNAAAWDTASRSFAFLGDGLDGSVQAVAAGNNGEAYFGGVFTTFSNGDSAGNSSHIARWNGKKWVGVGRSRRPNSVSDDMQISAIAISGDYLFVGGSFTAAGDVPARNIACYNRKTSRWSTLGEGGNNGVDGSVEAIYASLSGAIYVGGRFKQAGVVPANNIARWDSTRGWSALGTGVRGPFAGGTFVYAITEVSSISLVGLNGLFVGGRFDTAGAVPAANVACWNGTSWSALGAGVTSTAGGGASDGTVYALQPYTRLRISTVLYVGGDFRYAGGSPATYVAEWNGATWKALGEPGYEGVLGPVYAMAAGSPWLYAGGRFILAGKGVHVRNIARWNGTDWSSLDIGLDSTVYALAYSGNSLYASGLFRAAGKPIVNHIVRWGVSDSSWHTLGSGLNDWASALTASGNDLYVGGNFTQAGSKESFKLAHWSQSLVTTSVAAELGAPGIYALEQNYPNPFNPSTTISYTLPQRSYVTLTVYTTLGQRVAELVNRMEEAGHHEVRFDAHTLATGVYFYRMEVRAPVDAPSGNGPGRQTAAGAKTFVQSRKLLLLR